MQEINPEIPILICSADINCEFANRKDIFISKPFNVELLSQKIRELLAKKYPSKYAEVSN